MEKSDWSTIIGHAPRQSLQGILWRVVESQEDIATLDLVDTLAEQSLLEELLDDSKPTMPESARELHYLLSTPFRYPPLQWGSRFGTATEASLFYGALKPETAFAELAFYRFVFRAGMETDFPQKTIVTNHTLFSAKYILNPGLDLRVAPFENYSDILRHKSNYGSAQKLGTAMRTAGFNGFHFTSARCPNKGTNVALFTPDGISSKRPVEQNQCYCETGAEYVSVKVAFDIYNFPLDIFLVGGALPTPA